MTAPFHRSRLVNALELLQADTSSLWYISSILGQALVRMETEYFSPQGLQQFAESLSSLKSAAAKLQLVSSTQQMRRIENYVRGADVDQRMLRALTSELLTRVMDDLESRVFLAVTPEAASFYQPKEALFGKAVESQFPSVMFEIEEAGKCRAVGLYTACVFHLMRAFEVSIRAVARSLSIPDPLKPADRNWGNLLKAVKAEIDRRWPASADRLHGDGRIFESIYASLDAVKNPWRNSTMHVEGKYTEEEARHIWNATEGFMRALSARCDEEGLPLA